FLRPCEKKFAPDPLSPGLRMAGRHSRDRSRHQMLGGGERETYKMLGLAPLNAVLHRVGEVADQAAPRPGGPRRWTATTRSITAARAREVPGSTVGCSGSGGSASSASSTAAVPSKSPEAA